MAVRLGSSGKGPAKFVRAGAAKHAAVIRGMCRGSQTPLVTLQSMSPDFLGHLLTCRRARENVRAKELTA